VDQVMQRRLQAILWDVDGTLAETERNGHLPAFNAAFAELGLPWCWDTATYDALLRIGGGRERMAAWLEQTSPASVDPALLDALVASKKRHYSERLRGGSIPLRPGVARLLEEGAAAGLPQLIVTTSSQAAVVALLQGSLAPHAHGFGGWISGDDVQRKKPDPEGYRMAVAKLGLEADRILVVEDSPQGLTAAVAAGLPTLVTLSEVTQAEPPECFEQARAVINHLGTTAQPLEVLRGPACPQGQVTLSWLEQLLPPA
jgi:HAD superfamily hydrolase (TIGR01509 family)